MKTLFAWSFLLAGLFIALHSCSDDDNSGNNPSNVPENILNYFNEQFPDAKDVTWETKANGYYTASFSTLNDPQSSNTAWYSQSGNLEMTHYEIPFSNLPATVRTAFDSTTYGQSGSGWKVDDEVDVLQRNGHETLYVIEVKKTENGIETEVDLYFTANGVLVKEVADSEVDDDYGSYLPQQLNGNIESWLAASKYKDASIVEIDCEDDGTEVELVYQGLKVDVFFDCDQQWVYTKTKYGQRDRDLIPSAILTAVENSTPWQNGYNCIDDIYFYETAQAGNYYCFELEKITGNDDDIDVYVDENGIILQQRPTSDTGSTGSNVPVESDIQAFIDEKYPGAVIIEKEYDDGLLEVEIWHENLEKTLKFNGRNEWVMSEWDVAQLPDALKAILENEGYRLDKDDIEYKETAEKQWYEVEATKNGREYDIQIDTDGNILSIRED